jgi:hypothetical protein
VPIRVVLAGVPPLLAAIVRDVFADDSAVAVGAVLEPGVFHAPDADHVAGSAAVLVLGVGDHEEFTPPWAILRRYPQLVVLGLSDDARRAWSCRLVPTCAALGQPSPDQLRQAVQDATASPIWTVTST